MDGELKLMDGQYDYDEGDDNFSTEESESDDMDLDLSLPKTKTKMWGLIELLKLCTTFINSGGRKHKITFDELGRFSGECRSKFPCFFSETWRFVINQLGNLLRNFRGKVYARHIVPNLDKPNKLAKIPKQYRFMVEQTDWDNFVAYIQSDKFKDVSKSRKEARSKYVYDHQLGHDGYSYLREKLVAS
ncbi:hypothetical protein Hdeb2414_s0010g00339221 [Helianthus debilis subsp. tardiflorus]